MAKPKFLYHASPTNGIKILEPKSDSLPEGFDIGPVVFASDKISFASLFLLTKDIKK